MHVLWKPLVLFEHEKLKYEIHDMFGKKSMEHVLQMQQISLLPK